ncbi:MAG: site-specific integrase, partial [Chlorobium sp.]|nr:site-specific integrase [Chlorobium sp.]
VLDIDELVADLGHHVDHSLTQSRLRLHFNNLQTLKSIYLLRSTPATHFELHPIQKGGVFMDYLVSTAAGYHFRIKVPKSLRDVVKKQEIRRALHTTDLRQARRLAYTCAQKCYEIFQSLRGDNPMSRMPNFSRIDIAELVTPNGFILKGIKTDPLHHDAEMKALDHLVDKLVGASAPVPAPIPIATGLSEILLSDAIEQHIAERISAKPSTKAYYVDGGGKEEFDLLLKVIGDRPISQLRRTQAREVLDTLKSLPPRFNRKKKYRGKSIAQIIEMGDPPRAASTVNNTMYHADTLFKWLAQNEYTTRNFFEDLRTENNPTERCHIPDEALRALFSHNIWKNHQYSYAYQYWLCLLSLYSGARQNELAQLRFKDVKTEDGILYLNIVDSEDGNSVKTTAGIRRVPVHPHLLNLGFGEFVKSRQHVERLFGGDGLTYSEKDQSWANNASSWFYRLRQDLGCFEDGEVFHSFRNLAIEKFIAMPGALERHIKAVVGHSDRLSPEAQAPDVTVDRYGKRKYPIRSLYNLVCRLDFSHVLTDVKPWHPEIVPIKRMKRAASA